MEFKLILWLAMPCASLMRVSPYWNLNLDKLCLRLAIRPMRVSPYWNLNAMIRISPCNFAYESFTILEFKSNIVSNDDITATNESFTILEFK